jgi:transposase
MVERFFNKIKQCRRVATRYDKLADRAATRVGTGNIPKATQQSLK